MDIGKISSYVASLCMLTSCISSDNVKTSENVDLKRYMGKWYEIARFETRFQKGLKDASAMYVLRDDNQVDIVNIGNDKLGNVKIAKATAYVPDENVKSKLRVSFFYPFYGDYYILELAKDYSWALVGSSTKDYLWILSRTKQISDESLEHILNLAIKRGYDIDKFVFNTNETQ